MPGKQLLSLQAQFRWVIVNELLIDIPLATGNQGLWPESDQPVSGWSLLTGYGAFEIAFDLAGAMK